MSLKVIYNHNLKGIVSNVTLNGVNLVDWTMCLTDNFIPNFQKNITQNYDSSKSEKSISKILNGAMPNSQK